MEGIWGEGHHRMGASEGKGHHSKEGITGWRASQDGGHLREKGITTKRASQDGGHLGGRAS